MICLYFSIWKISLRTTFLYKNIINDNFYVPTIPSIKICLYEKNNQWELFYTERSSSMVFLSEKVINNYFFYRDRSSTMTIIFETVINHDFSIRKANQRLRSLFDTKRSSTIIVLCEKAINDDVCIGMYFKSDSYDYWCFSFIYKIQKCICFAIVK